ncbi:DUF3253 domain-containing protein [Qipengyuania sp. MTN3-11]|uniref:DUF3253 domain-containing protein n=1 Tax=Qipengyuania sp. MTN3-11 TaxID=3056557 RepID=UPI0036F32488
MVAGIIAESDDLTMAKQDNARDAILKLLAQRDVGKSICPSEVARALADGGDWRGEMAGVHRATDGLLADGAIAISWKGERLTRRRGPYRICISET